jgi:hypothetical protein
MNFAQGALRATRYVAELRRSGKTGVHDMNAVLGLP